MKIFKIKNLFALLLTAMVAVSCVKSDDFDIPNTETGEVNIDGTIIDIDDLYDLWAQEVATNQANTLFFEETNQYISGFVISSDEAGNFFEEIIIQNNAENPTRGVKVLIDVNPLYTRYEVGRKVFVKLDGLTVGLNSGVLTLGFGGNGEDIEKISGPLEEEYIVRSNETATIVPTVKTLSQLSNRDLNTLIQLPNAQFTESELGLGFANQVGDQFDGDRTIESCSDDGGSILFQTSTFADFKGVSLPQGAGSLTAVFQKDFFGEVYSLAVRDLSDLDFSGNRCEPSLLNPGLEATTTFDAVYSRYNQEGGYVEFSEDEDELVIEGYVIGACQSSLSSNDHDA